jgi:pyruvate dehydrogenase E2 component (dihydrolipoamide acetyltransferase)
MVTHILLPHLGESIESATLAAWHKRVGDTVQRGDELADIESDKATMPLESPANGVLLAILVGEGARVRIGDLLAVIGREGESWPTEADSASGAEVPAPAPIPSPAVPPVIPQPATPEPAPHRYRITPLARRMAKELGVDLAAVHPARGDKIAAADVERFAARQEQTPGATPARRIPLSGLRQIVGRRMTESAQQVPQFSVSMQANAGRMMALRATLAEAGHKVSVTALLVRLVANVLRDHPLLNAQFDSDMVVVYETCNIGVAVATPDGLRVPVIHGAEHLTLLDISHHVTDLSQKARDGRLSAAEIADGTFTISNLGMFDVAQFVPLVNPPQSAILGVGQVQSMFMPDASGQAALTPLITLTLAADHRVVDGADAAAFLAALKTEIERCLIYRIE